MTAATKLERMQQLIAAFQALRQAGQGERLRRMAGFITAFEQLERPACRREYNLFSLMAVETDEVRHSRLLAWLLDERAEHGQGPLFLQVLLASCQIPLDPADLKRYRVQTEHAGVESIIDILIYRPHKFLIYLENKVWAAEGPNQVDREYRDLTRLGQVLRVPAGQRFALFLTPTGRPPVSGDAQPWQLLSYSRLAHAFQGLLPGLTDPKLVLILQDWLATIRTFGGYYDAE